MMTSDPANLRPVLTVAGLRLGVLAILPVLPGVTVFSMVVGATIAQKGLAFTHSLLMNAFVYAGFSQLVAMEAWPDVPSVGALLTLALIAVTINARMLLVGASLQPWLRHLPAWQSYPLMLLNTDVGWITAMRYRQEGGNDVGFLVGGGIVLWLLWMSATSAGYWFGALIANPRAVALDLVMPVFFGTMLIPLWRGYRRAIGWVIAGTVAFAIHALFGGWWFIVVGALAGAAAEGWRE